MGQLGEAAKPARSGRAVDVKGRRRGARAGGARARLPRPRRAAQSDRRLGMPRARLRGGRYARAPASQLALRAGAPL
jgi:hypothetical protein